MNTTTEPYVLFGSTKPFLPPPWTTTDDRVRGGASQSHLSALPDNRARFHGHLDTSTLGGAGFASQFSPPPLPPRVLDGIVGNDDGEQEGSWWDLSGYDGIEVRAGKKGDGKVYTFILKDEVPAGKREEDGREKAGTNWEVDFKVGQEKSSSAEGGEIEEEGAGDDELTRIWVPWEEFKATYRGKDKKDPGELKTGEIRRIGLMMRSYFGKQEGDFSVVLWSIRARKTPNWDKEEEAEEEEEEKSKCTNAVGRPQGSTIPQVVNTRNEQRAGKDKETGLLVGFCTVS